MLLRYCVLTAIAINMSTHHSAQVKLRDIHFSCRFTVYFFFSYLSGDYSVQSAGHQGNINKTCKYLTGNECFFLSSGTRRCKRINNNNSALYAICTNRKTKTNV